MGILERIRKKQLNNRGSGIVMVLVTVAFMGLLSSMLMFASFNGYKMRLTDKTTKGNFYGSETVLDEINLGLQSVVSESLEVAYQDVMENYALYDNPAKRNNMLYEKYYQELRTRLQVSDERKTYGKVDVLIGCLSDEAKGDGNGTRSGFKTYGAIIEGGSSNPADEYILKMEENKGLLLKGIEVTSVDQRGAVSIIDTDIRIAMPKFNFTDGTTYPDLNRYCLLTSGPISFEPTKELTRFEVAGGVCADSINLAATIDKATDKVTKLDKPAHVEFKPSPAAKKDEPGLIISNKDIFVNKGSLTTTQMELWANNIKLNSAKGNFTGSAYVENDLVLTGEDCDVKLAGTYVGYGASEGADKSSAILINGRKSHLDLSKLKSIHIGGYGYVGTKANENSKGFDENLLNSSQKDFFNTHKNDSDITMGESVAVKSNQLIYLVPPEALGCVRGMDGTAGKSAFNRNPLTAEEYEKILNNRSDYVLMNPKYVVNGKTLDYYTGDNGPRVIFKHTNNGSLVYCYLNFTDQDKANEYFKDYYHTNQATVDKYTRLYVDALKMGNAESIVQLNLAGNALTYSDDMSAGQLVSSVGDSAVRAKTEGDLRKIKFALSKKLLPSLEDLKNTEGSSDLFSNLINEAKLNDLLTGVAGYKTLTNAEGKKVIVKKGNYTLTASDTDVQLIIATGKVTLNRDFDGVVLAKEGIVIKDDNSGDGKVQLTALTADEFAAILQAHEGPEYAMFLFKDGSQQFGGASGSATTESIDLADLVTYEGWNKK